MPTLLLTSDADGAFAFEDDVAVAGGTLEFRKPGYAPCLARASTPVLLVRLLPADATSTFDVATGGKILHPGGASLVIAPSSLCLLDGTPYNGPVTAALSVLDASSPASVAAMPGDFSAVGNGGATGQLETFGAVWIGITGEDGQELTVCAQPSPAAYTRLRHLTTPHPLLL